MRTLFAFCNVKPKAVSFIECIKSEDYVSSKA
jgi:hypothetical protein